MVYDTVHISRCATRYDKGLFQGKPHHFYFWGFYAKSYKAIWYLSRKSDMWSITQVQVWAVHKQKFSELRESKRVEQIINVEIFMFRASSSLKANRYRAWSTSWFWQRRQVIIEVMLFWCDYSYLRNCKGDIQGNKSRWISVLLECMFAYLY